MEIDKIQAVFRRAILQRLFNPRNEWTEKPRVYVVDPQWPCFRHLKYKRSSVLETSILDYSETVECCETGRPLDMDAFPYLKNWPCKCGAVIWRVRR